MHNMGVTIECERGKDGLGGACHGTPQCIKISCVGYVQMVDVSASEDVKPSMSSMGYSL